MICSFVRCYIHALHFPNLYIFSCQFPPSSVSLYQIICKCVKYIPKNLHFAPCKSTFSTLILPFAGAVKVPTEAHFSAPRANFY